MELIFLAEMSHIMKPKYYNVRLFVYVFKVTLSSFFFRYNSPLNFLWAGSLRALNKNGAEI